MDYWRQVKSKRRTVEFGHWQPRSYKRKRGHFSLYEMPPFVARMIKRSTYYLKEPLLISPQATAIFAVGSTAITFNFR